jgi:hypothetical protein
MEIRFLTTLVGNGFAFREGEVHTLTAEAAMEYVGAGLAEIVAKPDAQRAERAVPKAKAQKR